ncbi:isochorismate synthase [Polyangium sorediatum]|uniref:isochorismate synthase n=1 Tax=Polyangium sorediatum TaxID=889274 RepID=A0ABT6NPP1_9BACT|nr:isochorismate synthase [Polyangium sorediatum]MDI1430301.1 isochorismate synthase [Polyangium sorediatum]
MSSGLGADLLARLSRATRRGAGSAGELVAVVAPAPVVPAARLVAACTSAAPIVLFQAPPREGEEPIGVVGFGEVARVEGSGPERLAQITSAARRIFATLREERDAEAGGAPGPRFVGGLSFRTEARHVPPWTAFADASFSLARWMYVTRPGEAWLWLLARDGDLASERSAIEAEIASIEAAFVIAVQPAQDALPRGAGEGARIEGTSHEAFCSLVREALDAIRAGEIDKVVPVAATRVRPVRPLDARVALSRLAEAYAETTRFAVQRGEHVFLGASPERLISRRGRVVRTDGLAGTVRRGADDASLVQALLANAKERREHALVVEAIAAVLGPRCDTLDVPDAPSIRSLPNVHHLWTPIRGALRDDTHVLALVEALHPTPAVSGTPREQATAWIVTHEPDARGWYTGAVGWFDAAGDGDFSVAIRAGLVSPDEAWLYAGAGIVEGSDPLAEYAETRAKQAPMLAALGIQ